MTEADEGLEEHREFVPLIAAIQQAEVEAEEGKPTSLRLSTAGLHETLAHGLIPHAVGEGRTVFPVLRKVTGSDRAAVEMTHDHKEIGRLTDELERIRDELSRAGVSTAERERMSKVLHELRETVQRHFEHEEEACFQVLKAELSPEEAKEMYRAMEQAAADLRKLYE
jgi:iron-sulfur cluster repair protein YtfE (RIC family)